MRSLDHIDLAAADPGGMFAAIRSLPQQMREAWTIGASLDLPPSYKACSHVVVLGMGGSAIAGDLVGALAAASCPIPLIVLREYTLPAWVGPQALVIASSHSGDTEETVAAFREAQQRGSCLVAMTTDGTLRELARAWGIPLVAFTHPGPPRTALGFSFMLLLGLLRKLGLMTEEDQAVHEAIMAMEEQQGEVDLAVPEEHNPAKQLARRLYGSIVIVYGAGILAPVARRWKTQMNENSKVWSFFETFPELNHNAVMGYRFPADLARRLAIVMLTSSFDHLRVGIRQRATAELAQQYGVAVHAVAARGKSPLAHLMTSLHFGDYTSAYLAMLYRVDPTEIREIQQLKRTLSQA